MDDKLAEWMISLKAFYKINHRVIWKIIYMLLIAGYVAYLTYACIYDFEEALIVLIITGIVVSLYLYSITRDHFGQQINKGCYRPMRNRVDAKWTYIIWPLRILIIGVVGTSLYYITRDNPRKLISGAGLALLIIVGFIFSKHPRRVKWRPVIWGIALQFVFALFILKTKVGFYIFDFLGLLTQTVFGFVVDACIFVFGDTYQDHFFAFAVLPVVIYFSSIVAVLYHLGIMQAIVKKTSWLVQGTMKTSAPESVNAASNIIIGMTESTILIRPYLSKMTKSEFHAILCCGFATISGDGIGIYSSFGINTVHMLAALVMSAPAALAMSKLMYPETEEFVTDDELNLPKGKEHNNIVEAASTGAATAIPAVLNITANLIAAIALLALINGALGYGGGLIGFPELSVELILSYVFTPVAFMMGVEWEDCGLFAEMLGIKAFLNEFVAYERLSEFIHNRQSGIGPKISVRSEVIATYALCGFDNLGSVGMQLGTLMSLVPDRKRDFASVALRALVAAILACYVTACTAGLLYVPESTTPVNTTLSPVTMVTSS